MSGGACGGTKAKPLALLLAADGFALFGCQAFLLDWKSCLEYADYLTIFNKPELEAIFTNRHVSAADIHAQKEAFRISEIRNVIESFDSQLAKIFNELYQRSIDFGGHPNPCGTFSAVKIENSGPPILSMTAFMTDPPILQHARRALHRSALRPFLSFNIYLKQSSSCLVLKLK